MLKHCFQAFDTGYCSVAFTMTGFKMHAGGLAIKTKGTIPLIAEQFLYQH